MNTHDGTSKEDGQENQSTPVPLERFPPVWSGAGHTDSVIGAFELSDGRLLSWSKDNSLRLWSSRGEPQRVLGVVQSGADPHADIDSDLVVLFSHQGRVTRGYSYAPQITRSWYTHHSSGTPVVRDSASQTDHKKAAATIARTIKKYSVGVGGSDGPKSATTVYLSIRSSWATEVLLELDRKVLPHIRGIQCTNAAIYEEITGVMPELELDLLQLSFLPGTEVVNTLYGVQAQRVLLYSCADLERLERRNCAVTTVEVIDCPNLEQVYVTGPVGEAEVVYKKSELEDPREQQRGR
jgi:hypothetical protein